MTPLRAIPQPLTGSALYRWAKEFTPHFGLDLMDYVLAWKSEYCPHRDIRDWSIGDVTDCMACVAAKLDERGLLQIPPEAREQMKARVEACMPRDPHKPQPGPLTLQKGDPLLEKKRDIVRHIKALYSAEHGRDPTEAEGWAYLLARCAAHKIPAPDSLRNLHVRDKVALILSVLQEDFRDMRIL